METNTKIAIGISVAMVILIIIALVYYFVYYKGKNKTGGSSASSSSDPSSDPAAAVTAAAVPGGGTLAAVPISTTSLVSTAATTSAAVPGGGTPAAVPISTTSLVSTAATTSAAAPIAPVIIPPIAMNTATSLKAAAAAIAAAAPATPLGSVVSLTLLPDPTNCTKCNPGCTPGNCLWGCPFGTGVYSNDNESLPVNPMIISDKSSGISRYFIIGNNKYYYYDDMTSTTVSSCPPIQNFGKPGLEYCYACDSQSEASYNDGKHYGCPYGLTTEHTIPQIYSTDSTGSLGQYDLTNDTHLNIPGNVPLYYMGAYDPVKCPINGGSTIAELFKTNAASGVGKTLQTPSAAAILNAITSNPLYSDYMAGRYGTPSTSDVQMYVNEISNFSSGDYISYWKYKSIPGSIAGVDNILNGSMHGLAVNAANAGTPIAWPAPVSS